MTTATARLKRLPRWLVGDWSPLIRDPLDLMRLALLVGAFVTLAVGPREQSFRLLLTFLITLVPRALDVPRPFDFAFIAAMWFQAWGNVFGAFDRVYAYDKIVHFALPCATAALVYLALVRFKVVPDLEEERGINPRAAILLLAAATGVSFGGALYELYEWFADHYLGAHLYVAYGDSIGDLTDDGLGSLMGGALILVWDRYGWGTRRRVPSASRPDPVARAGERVVERLAPIGGPVRIRRAPFHALRVGLAAGAVALAVVTGWHVLLPAAAGVVLYLALVALRVVPDLFHRAGIHERAGVALVGFSLGLAAGVVYELGVFLADHAFGAGIQMDYPLLIRHLALYALGALIAAAGLVAPMRAPTARPGSEGIPAGS